MELIYTRALTEHLRGQLDLPFWSQYLNNNVGNPIAHGFLPTYKIILALGPRNLANCLQAIDVPQSIDPGPEVQQHQPAVHVL